MKLIKLLVFLITVASAFISAQDVPDWVENKGNSPWFREDIYITGFGIAAFTKHDEITKIGLLAEENAKKNLCEKIQVQVKSLTKTYKQQTDFDFQQKLESEVISMSEIELLGLKKEMYTDRKKGWAYCLVYVPKDYLIKGYEYKLFEKIKELDGLYITAREFEKNGHKEKAIQNYLDCYPVLSTINDLQTVLLGLGKVPDKEIEIDRTGLNNSINRLVTTVNSLNDLAFFVAFAFKEQTKNEELKGVIISPLTYMNTGMSSMFSKQFRESVEHHLVTNNKWETYPIKKYDPSIENMNKIRYAVKGSYWDSENKIYMNIYLSEIISGIKKASIEYAIDKSMIDETYIPIQPNNYIKAVQDQDIFTTNEIQTNGLNLEVYTNKGQDDLIFCEGEKMKIYLKTNMPCYIRLIYHLSDSNRILFLNNEFLNIDKVNKIYELPFTFVCRPPFGVETLQVNARELPFPAIKTYEENGLIYIDEKLSVIIDKSREHNSEILQSEKRLTITTMPN